MICDLIVSIASADESAFGRPNKATLSHQTLIELFIEEVPEKFNFLDADGNFKDISEWGRVGLSENGEVTQIYLDEFTSDGHYRLEWLPDSVRHLNLGLNNWKDIIEWENLPKALATFCAYDNRLEGTLAIGDIPDSLWALLLGGNNLSGTLDFSHVPNDLEILDLSCNRFTGSLSLVSIKRRIDVVDYDLLYTLMHATEKPPGEWYFGFDISRNNIEGDILVDDVAKVRSIEPFRDTLSEQVVDRYGQIVKLTINT